MERYLFDVLLFMFLATCLLLPHSLVVNIFVTTPTFYEDFFYMYQCVVVLGNPYRVVDSFFFQMTAAASRFLVEGPKAHAQFS
jgi:hypothetical protein